MSWRCGIIGLPNAGKTTIFNALTCGAAEVAPYPFCTISPNTGVALVPDARLARLGPTFIKLAQLFSSRADILPEPYLSEIGKLQDQVPPNPPEDILRVIEAELGARVDDLFQDFQREPLAAASLGQVHRARVGDRDVVVKVLRPGVEEAVALDLDISFRFLFWLNILFPNHHVRALTNVVREFSVRVRAEMDFRTEADNIERFQRSFKDDRRVRAPAVLPQFTRRRVMVMEYVQGTKIDRLHEKFQAGRLSFRQVMESLTGVYLRMMMVDGFMHADPHPGNLFVQDDGTLVLLDWGAVLEVPKWTRESILGVALAVGREDIDGVINEMYRMGMISSEVSRGEIREAATEILRITKRLKCDLILIATHGRSGLAHLLIGGVAERVVRTAPCPVLTVRHPAMRVKGA